MDEQSEGQEGLAAGPTHKGGRRQTGAPTCKAASHVLGQQRAVRAGTGEPGRVGVDLRGWQTQVLAATVAEGSPLTPVHPCGGKGREAG